MNENLNLVEILKDCPKGTKLYSTTYGDVELIKVHLNSSSDYQIGIRLSNGSADILTKDGKILADYNGECTLFPSKEQRDWSKFKVRKPKFDPTTLKLFDKVLVKLGDESYNIWYADFVSRPTYTRIAGPMTISAGDTDIVIPYNDDTKHLVGTNEEAPEFYRYWEI